MAHGGVKDNGYVRAKAAQRNARVSNFETDTVSWYVQEIQKHSLLKHEESVKLFNDHSTFDPETKCNVWGESREDKRAKDRIVTANLRLVFSIAKGYRSSGLPLEDLVQEGNIGLMKAVDRYNPNMGFRFSTYATWWIRQAIQQHVIKRRKTIRLPAHALGLQKKMLHASAEFKAEMGSEPSAEELAELLGTSERIVKATMVSGRQVISLSTPLGNEENGDTLGDTIADSSTRANPFESVAEDELLSVVRKVLCKLTPKEASILRLRFGLDEQADDHVGFPITQRELEGVVLRGEPLVNESDDELSEEIA